MELQFKSLAFLLAVFFVSYFFIKKCVPKSSFSISDEAYKEIWINISLITVIFFSASNKVLLYLLIFAFSVARGWATKKSNTDILVVYLTLVFITPQVYYYPDIAGIIRLFQIDPARFGSLVLLLPLLFNSQQTVSSGAFNPSQRPSGVSGNKLKYLDAAMLLYPLMIIFITAQRYTGTHVFRVGLEHALDVLIPYFVFTRVLLNIESMRSVLQTIAVCGLVSACVSIFEIAKAYKLYSVLQAVYDSPWQLSAMLYRGGLLRAQSITTAPIYLAMLMTFCITAYLAAKKTESSKVIWIGIILLVVGMFTSASRGPIVCTAIGGLVYFIGLKFSSKNFGRVLIFIWITAAASLTFGWLDEITDSVSSLLSSVGSFAERKNVDYRRELYNTAIALIKQSPIFGVPNYGYEMQHLVQGEGIIDMVNTYIHKTLDFGVVGLTLFIAPYLVTLSMLIKALKVSESPERHMLIACGAGLTAILLTLITTSIGYTTTLQLTILSAVIASIYRNQFFPLENGSKMNAIVKAGPN